MKKRKFKLLTSLTSLVLVVAVMAVGVWAAIQQNLTITSEVSFTANGISGTLTAEVTGEKDNAANVYGTLNSDTFSPTDDLVPTWEIGEIEFIPDETSGIPTDIVYTVTVLNSGSGSIAVNLTTSGDVPIVMDENITAVIKTSTDISTTALTAPTQSEELTDYTPSWGSVFTGTGVTFNIAPGATGGFAVVLHVEDYATSISAFDINFNVSLTLAT